jgi:hypothetical protein
MFLRSVSVVIALAGVAVAQGIVVHGAPVAGQNQYYSVNPSTGTTASISPAASFIVAGFAWSPNLGFVGLQSNNFVSVNTNANTTSIIGPIGGGLNASGLDILPDGRAFTVPTTTGQVRLHSINTTTGTATAIGTPMAIQDAVVAAGGPNTSPFMISLGSVGSTLYSLETGSGSIVALNPDTGAASVVGGTAGSLLAGTLSNGNARARYTGFASLTGADLNGDGAYDTLFGGVNFFDDDNNPGTPTVRFGGIAQFDLANGSWELIGNNPGQIYFGMAAVPVPEPTTLLLCGAAWLLGRRLAKQMRPS